jgi:pyruvate dehydrogenase E1 component beta subunit
MYRVALDRARLLHEGSDVTIAAFSYMALEALTAARSLLEAMAISVEVLDMRSVSPLDSRRVVDSVRKTGRLIVADTAMRTGGIGGELLSQVVEQAFGFFKAPPVRLASPDHPSPTSHFMNEGYYPSARNIADEVLNLLGRTERSGRYEQLCRLTSRAGPHDTPNREFCGPF